ncbi:hypothetical protein QBC41DRAFT_214798 [Cercophora samala]|uniref:RecQ mediated genome instability protein 1 OB-fold domain-containing protein n=1 Tax=Cercophora samala TaxID=330535 RepID=A0AA39ZM45_9PEZI|nr:hypothetical protein QBC41DRAFT_214798 [Cercophora samala]
MAPEPGRSCNNRRFHPYENSYVDSPLKLLRRPTDQNARSRSTVDSGSNETEELHELGSLSNPIDLTGLLINSPTPPGKSTGGKNVAPLEVPPQPDFGRVKSNDSGPQSEKALTTPKVIQPRQHSQPNLTSHSPAELISERAPSHNNPTENTQPRTPQKKTINKPTIPPQHPSPPTLTSHSHMIPQKRPSTQSVPHERPSQRSRLMPPPAPPGITSRPNPPPPNNQTMSLPHQLQTSLSTTPLPLPSIPFLTRLVTSRTPPPPFPSLLATTRARVLSSDITTDILDPSYTHSHSFPPDLPNPLTKSTSLPHDVAVQVLDIVNISKSKWEQVEELEAKARGEEKRGREVIRLPTGGDGDDADGGVGGGVDQGVTTQGGTQFRQERERAEGGGGGGKATHKILFQDAKGGKVYGVELVRVEKFGVGQTNIGEKWILKRGMSVSRGVLMLEPGGCEYLGGKVEVWNRAWHEGRLERLKREAVGEGE